MNGMNGLKGSNGVMLVLVMLMWLTVLAAQAAAQTALISQVLPNPVVSESGGEAVELYNPGGSALDISGWTLATEVSQTDVTFPQGAVIRAHGYYLVADVGWGSLRDNMSWPGADHEEALGLNNADSGVALLANGTLVDSVGWGSAAGINEGLFEGTPAAVPSDGLALRRAFSNGTHADTGDNSADFSVWAPAWHNSSSAGGASQGAWSVLFEVLIVNSAPSVSGVAVLSDDLADAGIQVAPVPKGFAEVRLRAEVSDRNGASDIGAVRASAAGASADLMLNSTLNASHALYEGTLLLPHYLAPGTYDVMVSAEDSGNASASSSAQFGYLGLLALELDSTSLSLEMLGSAPGTLSGDTSLETPLSPTVRNIGNLALGLGVRATDLVGAEATIPADALSVSSGNITATLASGEAMLPLGLLPGPLSAAPLDITLAAAGAYPAGAYRGSIEFSPLP